MREGDPAVEILKDARESRADLLVLATGSYGQDGPTPGRALAQVLEGARCPVLLLGEQALARLSSSTTATATTTAARG